MLAGIVEQAGILAERLDNDLFQRQIGHAGFFSQLVAVGHIGLMMLVMVILERFLRHEGCESLIVIRKRRQFESHGGVSFV